MGAVGAVGAAEHTGAAGAMAGTGPTGLLEQQKLWAQQELWE